MTQKEAVEQAILKVVGTYTNYLTSTQREEVLLILQKGLRDGSISLSENSRAKYSTIDGSLKYAKTILADHLRKSPLLNGGKQHLPTPRKNSTRDMLKKLLLNKGHLLSKEEKSALEQEIRELSDEPVSISIDDLPDTVKDIFK